MSDGPQPQRYVVYSVVGEQLGIYDTYDEAHMETACHVGAVVRPCDPSFEEQLRDAKKDLARYRQNTAEHLHCMKALLAGSPKLIERLNIAMTALRTVAEWGLPGQNRTWIDGEEEALAAIDKLAAVCVDALEKIKAL